MTRRSLPPLLALALFAGPLTSVALAFSPAPPALSGTKSVAGTYTPGSSVTYSVSLTNSGLGGQADNPGDEFTDVLPAQLTLVSASATSGTASIGGNTVHWNGALASSGFTVQITIVATINAATPTGTLVSNQGSFFSDQDVNGTNETAHVTSDPSTPIPTDDPTPFVVAAAPVASVPTLSVWGLAALAFAFVVAAISVRRRRV